MIAGLSIKIRRTTIDQGDESNALSDCRPRRELIIGRARELMSMQNVVGDFALITLRR
jgi:hypothetical protein